MKAIRLSLARLLLHAHLRRVAQLVLLEASVVFLRGGAMVAFKLEGKLVVREGRRIQ